MSSWVRFENKISEKAVYIVCDEIFMPLLLTENSLSEYFYCSSATLSIEIYNLKGEIVKSLYKSIIPSRLQTIILS